MKPNELQRTPSSRRVTPRARRNGFGLLTLLLWIIGVASLAAIALFVSDSDPGSRRDRQLREEAFSAAEAGLAGFLNAPTWEDAGLDQVSSAGAAEVLSEKLLDLGDGRAVYLIVARATVRPSRGEPVVRQVSSLAIRREATGELSPIPSSWREER